MNEWGEGAPGRGNSAGLRPEGKRSARWRICACLSCAGEGAQRSGGDEAAEVSGDPKVLVTESTGAGGRGCMQDLFGEGLGTEWTWRQMKRSSEPVQFSGLSSRWCLLPGGATPETLRAGAQGESTRSSPGAC